MKYLFFFLLLVPLVAADIDFSIKPSASINNTATMLNPTSFYNGSQINLGFYFITSKQVASISSGRRGTSLWYDMVVNVVEDNYAPTEIVLAQVVLINKGHIPDYNGKIVSYMIDPEGNKFLEIEQDFDVVQPACSGSRYNFFTDTCLYNNGTEVAPFKYYLQRNISLPLEALEGDWEFVAEFSSNTQPKITLKDTFNISVLIRNLYIVVGILLFLAYLFLRERKHTNLSERRGYPKR